MSGCLAVKFNSCNNLLSFVHTIVVIILLYVRLNIRWIYYSKLKNMLQVLSLGHRKLVLFFFVVALYNWFSGKSYICYEKHKKCTIPCFCHQPVFQTSVAFVLHLQAGYEVDHYFRNPDLCRSTEKTDDSTKNSVLKVCSNLRFPDKTFSSYSFPTNSTYQTTLCWFI